MSGEWGQTSMGPPRTKAACMLAGDYDPIRVLRPRPEARDLGLQREAPGLPDLGPVVRTRGAHLGFAAPS